MNISHEDVYFYLDLTKDLLKKKEIIKTIKYYIEEKNKANLKGHYSLLIFQEEGNPIFITDKKDSGIIANSIEENWKTRPKEQSFFENGLFYIFSYIAETVRKKSKFYRIIVITDTPSDLSDDYQEALFNLVSKIKNFPTFIDIIRLSAEDQRFFSDDVKLNMLASDTKGGIFYIKDKKEFLNIIKKLVKSKQYVSTFADRPDLIEITKEDYAFYYNLAKSLKRSDEMNLKCYFCNEEICPVCMDVHDIPFICEDCKKSFHNCCITNYTINHNIGIPNILRCPSCDVLLKIDEDEIIELSGEVEVNSVKEYMEKEILADLQKLVSKKEKPIPKPTLNKKREIPPEKPISTFKGEPIRTIRIGGFFGKAYTVKKEGNKIVYERSSQTSFKPKTTRDRNNIIQSEKIILRQNNDS
ncbi:MAG: RING finger protein, partial [Promethearchaeota archaeon]